MTTTIYIFVRNNDNSLSLWSLFYIYLLLTTIRRLDWPTLTNYNVQLHLQSQPQDLFYPVPQSYPVIQGPYIGPTFLIWNTEYPERWRPKCPDEKD